MAFSLESERPSAVALSIGPLRAFLSWIGERRAKHAQRVALSSLLDLDSSMLDDLGVNRQDVIEALQRPVEAGRTLHARRARAAQDWLSHP
jgi:uncharacterized protein YjiS (DUF1127 family)